MTLKIVDTIIIAKAKLADIAIVWMKLSKKSAQLIY